MILAHGLLDEVFKLCILLLETHHVNLDFVTESDRLENLGLELVDNPVLHFLGQLLVAFCVHLIALTDTFLFNFLVTFSLGGSTISSNLVIRLSYLHATMLDFVLINFTLRFFSSSFFEASLHDLAVLLIAHLIQHGEVCLV